VVLGSKDRSVDIVNEMLFGWLSRLFVCGLFVWLWRREKEQVNVQEEE
jgi:hypothetical protein